MRNWILPAAHWNRRFEFRVFRNAMGVDDGGPTDMMLLPSLFAEADNRDYLLFQCVPGISKTKSAARYFESTAGSVAYLVDGDPLEARSCALISSLRLVPNSRVASALYRRRMRPQAPHLAVTYTGRDALEQNAFREFGLLDVKALGKAAKARGINLSIFESSARPALEALDAAGAFRPIYMETAGGDHIFSDETPYSPWEQHGGGCNAFYSHWQLLYLEGAIEMGRVRVDLDWLLDESHKIEHDFSARPLLCTAPSHSRSAA